MRQAAMVCLLAGSLAGCAGGEDSFLAAPVSKAGSMFGNLLSFNKNETGAVATRASADEPIQCPQIEVLEGTAAYRVYNGADQTNGNVRYQYALGDVARECTKAGNEILIKVGVAGRVLLGPAGQPGSFTVPVRVAVRRDSDNKAAAAKLYQAPATIAFGQTQGEFTVVTEPLAVPFIQAHADEDYTVLVGFDAHPAEAKSSAGTRGKKASRQKP